MARTSFEQAAVAFAKQMKRRDLSRLTQEAYQRELERLIEYLARSRKRTGPGSVTAADLRAYAGTIKRQNRSLASRKTAVLLMRRWFAFLHERGDISTDPAVDLETPT
jgi:site-specific recombinase XerD